MKSSRDGGGALEKEKWVLCPICNNKTRIKVRPDIGAGMLIYLNVHNISLMI